MEQLYKDIDYLINKIHQGCLVEFANKQHSLGIVATNEESYRLFGIDFQINSRAEARAFLAGCILNNDNIHIYTKEEALEKARKGHFMNRKE